MSKPMVNPPSTFRGEATLSEALMNLSLNDRNNIEEEIHGVRCGAVDETPELIREALDQFDARLNDRKERNPGMTVLRNIVRISDDGASGAAASAPNSASARNCYLNDPEVRLRFLRWQCFDVDKAIERFVRFLETMTQFFGDYVADRPVRRSDFTSREKNALKKSRAQYLPFRDRSGRRVFVNLGSLNYHLEMTLTAKILLYVHWLVSQDVETQRKGIVWNSFSFDEDKEGSGFHFQKDITPNKTEKDKEDIMKAQENIPIRVVAYNIYFKDTPYARFLSYLYLWHIGPERRPFTRIHFGGQTENFYSMASFGIPVDVIPVTSSGALKFTNHSAWLDAMETIENSGYGDRQIVDCPLANDVVFRSGSTHRYNPGNAYYREVLESYALDHKLGKNKEKQRITQLVYDEIVGGRNGRFLEWWDKGKTWIVIVDPEVARKKISKTMKNVKDYQKRMKRAPPTEKPDKTVFLANSIIDSGSDTEVPNPVHALQEYYSMAHPSKRLKTSGCACFGDKSEGDACFGRDFFPIDS